jgi:histidinol dehydrogenase
MTVQTATPAGLKKLGPIVERLALAENLAAHQRAVRVRLDALNVGAGLPRDPQASSRSDRGVKPLLQKS